MKDNLLLLLSPFSHRQKNAVASTLAWMAETAGWGFDCYYDAFRTGDHFGGGPLAQAAPGRAYGATIAGHAHMEAWYRLLVQYDCRVVRLGESCFDALIDDLRIPVVASKDDPLALYRAAAATLGLPLPAKTIITGGSGEESYLYPLIGEERALALHASGPIEGGELERAGIKTVTAALLSADELERLRSGGITVAGVHDEYPVGEMRALSQSILSRWGDWCRGYFLGDPVVTACFLPWLYRTRRLALYAEPLKPLIGEDTLPRLDTDPVVYGRMFNDEDALALSRAGGCWQLVDPGRPPFPAAARPAAWHEPPADLFSAIDPGDEQLRRHAERGDILTAIVFWSGCVREMENFYRLNDLVAATGFKCGYAVTSATCALGAQTPFAAIALPRERGGVFPLVEPLLASSGIGFSLESYVPHERFDRHLDLAMQEIAAVLPAQLRPRGWWACLDTGLEADQRVPASIRSRPFGAFRPGEPAKPVHRSVAAHGFEYALSKAVTGSWEAPGAEPPFILPHTAGSWQGWSPFHAIEGIEDIKRAEKRCFLRGGPGYIAGTIDSCLWTFSLPHWRRGRELETMVDYILHGGRSGRLVNAHPYTVYRYAKLLGKQVREPGGTSTGTARLRWLALRGRQGFQALYRRRFK